MKKILSIVLLLAIIPSLLTAFDQNEEETKAVERAIKNYYQNGLVRSEPKLLDKIIHENSEMYFYNKEGKLQKEDKKTFLAHFDPENVDKSIKSEITNITVQSYVASVEIKIDGDKKDHIDYLNLIKEDGKWLITNCVSQEF